jgi:hypothetical protein
VGRHVLDVRLRREGMAAEGRCLERNHLWIHDWWLLSCTQYVLSIFIGKLCLTPTAPGGPRSAFGSAVACGILLGVFEGVGVLLNRVFSEGNRQQLPPREYLSSYPRLQPLTVFILSPRKLCTCTCTCVCTILDFVYIPSHHHS